MPLSSMAMKETLLSIFTACLCFDFLLAFCPLTYISLTPLDVMQGEYLMGVQAVKCLLDRISGRKVSEVTYVPYQIVCGNKMK